MPAGCGAVGQGLVTEALCEPVAQGRDAADVLVRSAAARREGGGDPDRAGHVLGVPLRRSRSCPPPRRIGWTGRALAHDEGAGALRAAELVGADADEVGRRGGDGEVEPRRALHGVGVQHRVGRRLADRGERLDRADLVVDEHHRDEGGVGRHGGHVEHAVGPDRDSDRRALGRHRACEHGVVLDAGAAPAGHRREPSTARLSASVPPLVNTTSPGRQPTGGELVTGVVERGGRRPGQAVDARRVAVTAANQGSIASSASGRSGRGGGVVEVGHAHRGPPWRCW